MVPHVLPLVLSSGAGACRMDEGHPGVCEGGVNDFAGPNAVGAGSIAPHGLGALTGHTPPMRGWCQDGSGCQMGAGRFPYRAQVYTVIAVPSVSASNLYVDDCA